MADLNSPLSMLTKDKERMNSYRFLLVNQLLADFCAKAAQVGSRSFTSFVGCGVQKGKGSSTPDLAAPWHMARLTNILGKVRVCN